MNIPFICISGKLEIADVSHGIKSLSGVSRDKDFLRSILGDDILESIEELCAYTRSPNQLTVKLPRPFGGFHFIKAVRNLSDGAVLYLAENECDLSEGEIVPLDDSATLDDEDLFPLELGAHTASDNTSFMNICTRAAAHISSSQLLADRILRLELQDSFTGNGPLPSSALPMLYTAFSLVCVAARSSEGDIELNISAGELTFDISVRTHLCGIPPFVGSSDDIMSLAVFLRGSRPFLKSALMCAATADIGLSFDISPSGVLSLNASNISSAMPSSEFKFPEEAPDTEALSDALIRFLLSVQEKQDQKE